MPSLKLLYRSAFPLGPAVWQLESAHFPAHVPIPPLSGQPHLEQGRGLLPAGVPAITPEFLEPAPKEPHKPPFQRQGIPPLLSQERQTPMSVPGLIYTSPLLPKRWIFKTNSFSVC